MKKYKLSTRISAYIAVILSLAMSGLTIRSLIVKRNAHSVSVTLANGIFAGFSVFTDTYNKANQINPDSFKYY